MTVSKECHGFMSISAHPETLTEGEHAYWPTGQSVGIVSFALKKEGVTLSQRKIAIKDLSPGQPILRIVIGTEGAASDDGETKLSWRVTDGEIYTVELEASGRANFKIGAIGQFEGNGSASLSITSVVGRVESVTESGKTIWQEEVKKILSYAKE